MESGQVTVIARAKTRPGMEEKLTELAAALVEPTRGEERCINYDLRRGPRIRRS